MSSPTPEGPDRLGSEPYRSPRPKRTGPSVATRFVSAARGTRFASTSVAVVAAALVVGGIAGSVATRTVTAQDPDTILSEAAHYIDGLKTRPDSALAVGSSAARTHVASSMPDVARILRRNSTLIDEAILAGLTEPLNYTASDITKAPVDTIFMLPRAEARKCYLAVGALTTLGGTADHPLVSRLLDECNAIDNSARTFLTDYTWTRAAVAFRNACLDASGRRPMEISKQFSVPFVHSKDSRRVPGFLDPVHDSMNTLGRQIEAIVSPRTCSTNPAGPLSATLR